jgi:anti-anti-sigma factor
MRMLVMEAKALARRGGKMALLNPTPLVAEALTIAGIDELIPIFDDAETAGTHLLDAVAN